MIVAYIQNPFSENIQNPVGLQCAAKNKKTDQLQNGIPQKITHQFFGFGSVNCQHQSHSYHADYPRLNPDQRLQRKRQNHPGKNTKGGTHAFHVYNCTGRIKILNTGTDNGRL